MRRQIVSTIIIIIIIIIIVIIIIITKACIRRHIYVKEVFVSLFSIRCGLRTREIISITTGNQ